MDLEIRRLGGRVTRRCADDRRDRGPGHVYAQRNRPQQLQEPRRHRQPGRRQGRRGPLVHRVAHSATGIGPGSKTRRTARSRNSSGYFLGAAMTGASPSLRTEPGVGASKKPKGPSIVIGTNQWWAVRRPEAMRCPSPATPSLLPHLATEIIASWMIRAALLAGRGGAEGRAGRRRLESCRCGRSGAKLTARRDELRQGLLHERRRVVAQLQAELRVALRELRQGVRRLKRQQARLTGEPGNPPSARMTRATKRSCIPPPAPRSSRTPQDARPSRCAARPVRSTPPRPSRRSHD